MSILDDAIAFATEAHGSIDQRRKYTGEPYIGHPLAVMENLRRYGITDDAVLAAAVLHDVVEDTPVTNDQVRARFGDRIADLVAEVTDVSRPQDGNRAARKALDRAHIGRASVDGKNIKLADLIDNSKSIASHDKGFAKVYLAEKALLIEMLADGHPALLAEARALLRL